jgi:hypothetical protein
MKRGYPVRRLKIKYDSIPIYTGSTGQPKPDNVEFGMGFRQGYEIANRTQIDKGIDQDTFFHRGSRKDSVLNLQIFCINS